MSHKDYALAIYIGRFQPFHVGHERCVDKALSIADKVLILVGSAFSSITPKNPFTFEQRKELIRIVYPNSEAVSIEPLSDYLYNDDFWVSQVQGIVSRYVGEGESIALIGDYSDSSSYYLKYFPQWDFIPAESKINIRATDIRKELFEVGVPTQYLDARIAEKLKKDFYVDPAKWSDKPSVYQELVKEYNYLVKYKSNPAFYAIKEYVEKLLGKIDDKEFVLKELEKLLEDWAKPKFPIQFITADATVLCSGHILLIERGRNPGKGLFAVPGGFVKPNEHIERAALRELKEETGIRVDNLILQSSIERVRVFDHPERSLRGRIVTHNYLIRLKDGKLPEVKGSDDASKAMWVPINHVFKYESKFFEDHFSMCSEFILGAKN